MFLILGAHVLVSSVMANPIFYLQNVWKCPDESRCGEWMTYGASDLEVRLRKGNVTEVNTDGNPEIGPWEFIPTDDVDTYFIKNVYTRLNGDHDSDYGKWLSISGGNNGYLYADESDRAPWKLVPVPNQTDTYYFQNKWGCASGESRCDMWLEFSGQNTCLSGETRVPWKLVTTTTTTTTTIDTALTFSLQSMWHCSSGEARCGKYLSWSGANVDISSVAVPWNFVRTRDPDTYYIKNLYGDESDSHYGQWLSYSSGYGRLYAEESERALWKLVPVPGQVDTYYIQNKPSGYWLCFTSDWAFLYPPGNTVDRVAWKMVPYRASVSDLESNYLGDTGKPSYGSNLALYIGAMGGFVFVSWMTFGRRSARVQNTYEPMLP